MSHHNFDMSDDLRSVINEALGATGQYPHGSYNSRDEGEIRFAVAADHKARVVLIDFGKPVHSLGMTAEEAESLADLITKKVWELRGIVS